MRRSNSTLRFFYPFVSSLIVAIFATTVLAGTFEQQGPFWQASLSHDECGAYDAETLLAEGWPEHAALAAEGARDDVDRIETMLGDGVTLLGSTNGGALLIVPRGWLSLSDLSGSLCPLFAHSLPEFSPEDERLTEMPSVAAWRDVVGLFGGQARYSHFALLGDKAFCAASDDRLLYSEVGSGQWLDLGHANDVVALGLLDAGPAGWDSHDRVYVATQDDGLWMRRAVAQEINWEKVGHARNVTALCGVDDNLYCVTIGGVLWRRPVEGGDVEWQKAGDAPGVVAMTGANGHLLYVDSQGKIFLADTSADPITWNRISNHASQASEMSP